MQETLRAVQSFRSKKVLNSPMLKLCYRRSFTFQLFKRRNVATAEEETEEEVMSDGGFHEAQVNNMEMAPVSMIVKRTL